MEFKPTNLLARKKKKSAGGKKQLYKTIAHYKSMGIPLGFIKDKIIGGAGRDFSVNPRTGQKWTVDEAAKYAWDSGKKLFDYGGKPYEAYEEKVKQEEKKEEKKKDDKTPINKLDEKKPVEKKAPEKKTQEQKTPEKKDDVKLVAPVKKEEQKSDTVIRARARMHQVN
tara:strand:+ start:2164 stop:2667 length:504 start_codon:yes stop_codon:yes gene_type:complete